MASKQRLFTGVSKTDIKLLSVELDIAAMELWGPIYPHDEKRFSRSITIENDLPVSNTPFGFLDLEIRAETAMQDDMPVAATKNFSITLAGLEMYPHEQKQGLFYDLPKTYELDVARLAVSTHVDCIIRNFDGDSWIEAPETIDTKHEFIQRWDIRPFNIIERNMTGQINLAQLEILHRCTSAVIDFAQRNKPF